MGIKLIENAKSEFHRLWVIRVALAYGAFNGVALVLCAFVGVLNPWFLLGVGLFVSIAIVVLRLASQADPALAKATEPVA